MLLALLLMVVLKVCEVIISKKNDLGHEVIGLFQYSSNVQEIIKWRKAKLLQKHVIILGKVFNFSNSSALCLTTYLWKIVKCRVEK